MLLTVEGLVKSFRGQRVLDNVSFELNEGEVVSIFGKSGAGKSTLLRCINGLETIDEGNIKINGEYLYRQNENFIEGAKGETLKKIRQSIGYVFQNFNLFPNLTVLDNIILSPVKAYKLDKDMAIERAVKLLEKLNILDKKDCFPYELSGGQRQRVAIARACILSPKIICFDEPTSAVDDEVKKSIADIIMGFKKENMAVLIVSHDKEFSYSISDRIIKIEDGKIIS
ncbi:MAG: Phosphonate-transporting ATPase [Caloramator sp.]|jgi:polar amino acid transport system ATP-binding protein|uniref:amino acid ABC transporter ATP-binding protein n=1 Tax=Caloramator sp. TaxID=1871330 RepID=UPI001D708B4F|nr:amino acid ABC transporter ATP-binding protein [Caloramator sp.]MBZ4662581.1 Phosphonate-transporting ATPase [Caloramator sp.]